MENRYKLNIPHKRKMLLIDGIIDIDCNNNEIISFSNITNENIFYDDGIDSYIFIEYVAQTAAAYNGSLINNYDYNNKVGFILNIKKVNCYIYNIKLNNKVYIFVKETLKDKNIAYYDGQVILYNGNINSLDEYEIIVNNENIIMDCSIMVMESSAENFINGDENEK